MLKTNSGFQAFMLLDSMKDNWPATAVGRQFLSYVFSEGGWLFFNDIISFLILDLHPFINLSWSSNHSRVEHTVGFRIIFEDLDGQVDFPARNRSSLVIMFLEAFCWRATGWTSFLSFYFGQNSIELVFLPLIHVGQSILSSFEVISHQFVHLLSEYCLVCVLILLLVAFTT